MAMNVFRLTGDIIHVIGILIVLHRLLVVQNAQGISRKCQELYLIVFLSRYLDLLTTFYSVYNSIMKELYIFSTTLSVFLMSPYCTYPSSETYRKEQDGFEHLKYAVLPSILAGALAYFTGHGFASIDVLEVSWTFSIILEAIATIPQVMMFRKYREVESFTGGSFIFMMGLYRFFYILSWIYRAHTERDYKHHYLVYICGVLQAVIGFAGFFLPPTESEGAVAAPLLPQLKRLWESLTTAESARFLKSAGLLIAGLLVFGAAGKSSVLLPFLFLWAAVIVFQIVRFVDQFSQNSAVKIVAMLFTSILLGPFAIVSIALFLLNFFKVPDRLGLLRPSVEEQDSSGTVAGEDSAGADPLREHLLAETGDEKISHDDTEPPETSNNASGDDGNLPDIPVV